MVWEDVGCKAPSYLIWKGTCEPFVSLMLDIASKEEEEPTEGGRPTEDRFIACLRYPRRGRGGLWDVSRKTGTPPQFGRAARICPLRSLALLCRL